MFFWDCPSNLGACQYRQRGLGVMANFLFDSSGPETDQQWPHTAACAGRPVHWWHSCGWWGGMLQSGTGGQSTLHIQQSALEPQCFHDFFDVEFCSVQREWNFCTFLVYFPFSVFSFKGDPKWRPKLAWRHRKCSTISICRQSLVVVCLVVLSGCAINI